MTTTDQGARAVLDVRGLHWATESNVVEAVLGRLAAHLETHLDLDRLFALAG